MKIESIDVYGVVENGHWQSLAAGLLVVVDNTVASFTCPDSTG